VPRSTRNESFTYDSLNRIASGQSSGTQWGEAYTTDAWGNMTAIGSYNSKPHESLSTSAGTNNQLVGFGYDAAGNMTSNGSVSYVYDAENRLISTNANGSYSYLYDGDGQRVEKCTPEGTTPGTCASGATGTLYWRGNFVSDALTETDLSGNVQNNYVFFNGQRVARVDSAGAVHYYFSDHLGSHGVVENATGSACEQDIDYYPYGGVQDDYCPNVAQNYKFTGKERDSESGLDNFGARYNASTMGRFMSPDPKTPSLKHLVNPQKWNKYAYVLNNPLALVDPDGKEEMTFVYRTFIAQQSINFMGNTYAGDNRGFSTAPNASSRSTITVRIETDPSIRPGNPIISQTSSAGESRQLDANGNTIDRDTAKTGLPVATGTRDTNGDAVVNITQDVKNPLSPVWQFMTPGISANLNVTATPNGSTVSATGTASNFPSGELNVTGPNGITTPVFQFTPQPGSTPLSLFRPDRDVDSTVNTNSDQSGDPQ
jgi:RHS repeat-associated protein